MLEDYGRKLVEIKRIMVVKLSQETLKVHVEKIHAHSEKKHRRNYETSGIRSTQNVVNYRSRFVLLLVRTRLSDN
jgi:hypothetical protein